MAPQEQVSQQQTMTTEKIEAISRVPLPLKKTISNPNQFKDFEIRLETK